MREAEPRCHERWRYRKSEKAVEEDLHDRGVGKAGRGRKNERKERREERKREFFMSAKICDNFKIDDKNRVSVLEK